MSLNLAGFVKKLLPSFDRSDLESDLETSLEAISTIQETYASLEQILKIFKFESKVNKDILKEFYSEVDKTKHKIKLSGNKNFAGDTLLLFKNIQINGEYLLREISDAVNDVIVSQALTAYKANILRAVAHYDFMTRYALDLSNFLYVMEADESKLELSKEYKLHAKQKEFIIKNVWIYARMLTVYGMEPEEFKNKLEAIQELTLPKENVDEVIDMYNTDKVDLFSNLPAGFIGSPIYSVRMVFATWSANRYKAIKDKKRLLELRYLHLKLMKEQGQSDVNMEKEIEHLASRIQKYDYELSKIEEDVND